MLQVVGKGLSALIEAQLAMPLDKSLQCSSWGTRPLSRAQVSAPQCNTQEYLSFSVHVWASMCQSKSWRAATVC